MTFPAIIFSLIMATLYASVFHFFKNGSLASLFFYIPISVAGFFGGQYLAELLNLHFIQLGTINFGVGSICSIGLLMIFGLVSGPLK